MEFLGAFDFDAVFVFCANCNQCHGKAISVCRLVSGVADYSQGPTVITL